MTVPGRDRIRSVLGLNRRTRFGDGAIDFGSTLSGDLGQVGPDFAPLPPEGMALRAPGLFSIKDFLPAYSIAAGQVRDDQGRRDRRRRIGRPREDQLVALERTIGLVACCAIRCLEPNWPGV